MVGCPSPFGHLQSLANPGFLPQEGNLQWGPLNQTLTLEFDRPMNQAMTSNAGDFILHYPTGSKADDGAIGWQDATHYQVSFDGPIPDAPPYSIDYSPSSDRLMGLDGLPLVDFAGFDLSN